jgi:hypothetical protein
MKSRCIADQEVDMGTLSPRGRLSAFLPVLTGCLLLSGCASETLFQSSFNSSAVGVPPAANQATGTVTLAGTPGSVEVVVAPTNATPPQPTGNWVKVSRAKGLGNPVNVMLCHLRPLRGDGTYSLLAVLYIPSGSGLATVEFATSSQAGAPNFGFLHLDFLENNKVRINDDNAQVFGTFTRNQMFTLAVTLQITASSATANVQLLGGSAASGSMEGINIVRPGFPLSLARQFGTVKFSMGSDWSGFFDVTDIIVTRKE